MACFRAVGLWVVLMSLFATAFLFGQQTTAISGDASKIVIPTSYTEDVYSFAISPDGRALVFQSTTPEGKRQLWRQAVDASKKPEPIAGTEGAGDKAFPFFSPDGKSIAFFAKEKLWQVDLAGGVPKELADAPAAAGGSWNGGSILFSGRGIGGSLQVIEGGRTRAIPMARGLYVAPKFVDDRRFIYFSRDSGGGAKMDLANLDGSAASARGLPSATAAAFTRGFLLFVTTAGSLNAVPFDPNALVASGKPQVVAERVGREDRLPGIAAFVVSPEGTVAYRETATLKRQMMWMDRAGTQLGAIGVPDTASPGNPRLSPDGQTVLFFRQQGAPMGSAWIMDTKTGAQRMFQNGSLGGVWSPGGDQVTLATQGNGPQLTTHPVRGGEAAMLSVQSGRGGGVGALFPDDWAANGHILYRFGRGSGSGTGGDLFAFPPNQSGPIPIVQSAASERNGRFSPDGNWVAYQSDESGRYEVYVQPFPGTAAQRQRVSLNGGVNPQWGRGGRELYFISPDNRLMVAPVESAINGEKRTIQVGPPKALFALAPGSEVDVDRTADRFLVLSNIEDSPPIVVLPNWAQKQAR